MAQFTQLTKEIENTINELESNQSSFQPKEKQQLLIAARELVDKLEEPEVAIWRVFYGVSIEVEFPIQLLRLLYSLKGTQH